MNRLAHLTSFRIALVPPYPVLLLTAAVGIVGSNSLVLSPIAGAVAISFDGAVAADVVVAGAVYGIATAISALALAPQADRIGAARSLWLALALLVVGLLLSALAPNLATLAVAQALAGLAAGAALPACYGLAVQIAPPGEESRTLGVVLAGWTLCLVAGVSGSAIVAELAHWRAVFALLAAGGLGVALAVRRNAGLDPAWRRRDERGGISEIVAEAASSEADPGAGATLARRAAGSEPVANTPLAALRVPGILPALGICGAFMTAFYGVYAYLGAHLESALGRSTASAGLATLAYGIGFGLAVRLDGLIDRHGRERVAPPAFAAIAMVYALLVPAAASYLALVALCGFWGVANHVGLNLIVGRLTALDETRRGAILGLNSAVTYAAVFVATLAFRPVFDARGLAACGALAAVCVLPALGDALRTRSRRRVTQDA